MQEQDTALSRRDFLAISGFSVAAAGLMTGCMRPPEEMVIPYLEQSPEMQPGQAFWYSTVCRACPAGCGALVKVRDGRPIKLEGNPDHPLSRGGLCAVGQASLLGLYDEMRFNNPLLHGKRVNWAELDAQISKSLDNLAASSGTVRVMSGSVNSPTEHTAIARFLSRFVDGKHIEYDPAPASAIPAAYEITHGIRILPQYRFDRAKVIVSFGADFLGTWISPVEFTAEYSARRDPEAPEEFSWHGQYETVLSPTGARADKRLALKPSEQIAALAYLARQFGEAGIPAPSLTNELRHEMDALAHRLEKHRGESLVVCGLQDLDTQQAVSAINHHLGNEEQTVLLSSPSNQRRGNDHALAGLIEEMKAGSVDALFILEANPVYDLPDSELFAGLLQQVPLTVALTERSNETTEHMQMVAALSHPLESWSDSEPVNGLAAIQQPCIRPLGNTRSAATSFTSWNHENSSDHDLVRDRWRTMIYPASANGESFDSFWTQCLQNGYAPIRDESTSYPPWHGVRSTSQSSERKGLELVLYSKTALPEGRHSSNPMLLELPDPISKISWDNYACLPEQEARRFGVHEGDYVHLKVKGRILTLPVHIQPGQAAGTVAVALGYGRDISARFRETGPRWLEDDVNTGPNGLVGVNAAPLLELRDGLIVTHRSSVTVKIAGGHTDLAKTQEYDWLDVPEKLTPPDGGHRDLLVEGTLGDYRHDPQHFVPHPHMEGDDLWPEDHPYYGHHWGLAIDLGKCTGCSACVVSCQLENNVPVVGKDEVRRNRELHWLRIDRYYRKNNSSDTTASFQPVMCQQCDNAPCETVCPVLATVHSDEGLNQQVYNRCVGTRYCANNCPYKMRRFNWFNYPRGTEKERLALNPDVTVRSRGIMEKCTFCVQRIQEGKQRAKRENRPLRDGEIKPACQQSCSAGAIVFGDMNDPNSEIARLISSGRSYKMLEELNVRPSVHYLAAVRNSDSTGKEVHHG
ncbi:4Fe-4S dicluster domain-containing protein [bacterium]|nr:4Fe-4S dicluster domain-containing protein [bacterium]